MRDRAKRPLRWKRGLWALLCVSIVGLLLPQAITGRLINLVQVLAPLQAGATRLADGAAEAMSGAPPSVPGDEHERALAKTRALRNTVAALSSRVTQLEEANRQLTGLRDRGLGARGVLIPARLVAGDVLNWRDSGLIDAGTLRGVQRQAPVATRTPGLTVGTEDGAANGMLVLAGETLVGSVEHAGTHTARVKLLSDPACRMPVALGRFEGDEFARVPSGQAAEFWLVGGPVGHLRIIDVDHRYLDQDPPDIRVGDVVTTSPDDPRLPLSLTIGTVSRIEPNPDNGLLYILTVQSAVGPRLREVYVLSMDGP